MQKAALGSCTKVQASAAEFLQQRRKARLFWLLLRSFAAFAGNDYSHAACPEGLHLATPGVEHPHGGNGVVVQDA